jgi:hypothetical protein
MNPASPGIGFSSNKTWCKQDRDCQSDRCRVIFKSHSRLHMRSIRAAVVQGFNRRTHRSRSSLPHFSLGRSAISYLCCYCRLIGDVGGTLTGAPGFGFVCPELVRAGVHVQKFGLQLTVFMSQTSSMPWQSLAVLSQVQASRLQEKLVPPGARPPDCAA